MRGANPAIFLIVWICTSALFAQSVPNDEYFARQWGLFNDGQSIEGQTGTAGADVDILAAWEIYSGISPVIVAVLSAGVDPHPEFADRLLEGFATRGDVFDSRDTGNRGTHLAGIIGAAVNNGSGIAGIHPAVRILPVRIAEGTSVNVNDVAEGIIQAVDHGADVILAAVTFSSFSQSLKDAVDYANLHNVVVIAPAGDDSSIDPVYPGGLEGCLSVNATTNQDTPASFSNFGDFIDLSAPGVHIWSTQHDGTRDGTYAYDSSSFAASAYVAGVTSLLRSYAPQISAQEVKQLLIDSVDDLGELGPDLIFGAGRINAFRALKLAPAPALRFEHREPLPETIAPDRITSFVIRIAEVGENVIPEAVFVFYRTPSSNFDFTKVVPLEKDQYLVELPGGPCGDTLEYFFLAVGDGGTLVTEPIHAPQSVYHARIDIENMIFYDDFETDRGWETVSGGGDATRGLWTRVDPVGTSAQPEYDFSPDEKQFCYVTGQHFSGPFELTDVDEGPVQLISPMIPIPEPDAQISFAYWFFWSGDGFEDFLSVEFSRDDGIHWTVVEHLSSSDGWMTHQFQLSDFPEARGQQLRVRFTTADIPNDSLTEAAVDEFRVTGIRCFSRPADANGDGRIDLTDFNLLLDCWSGPAGAEVDESCAVFDLDGTTRVDLKDFSIFQNLFATE